MKKWVWFVGFVIVSLYLIFWVGAVRNDYHYVKDEIFTDKDCDALAMSAAFFGAERTTKVLERRIDKELDSPEVSWYGGAVRKAALMERIEECVGE